MPEEDWMIVEMPREHWENVCKIGQGADCCKYMVVGGDGFGCAKDKGNEGFKHAIDSRTDMNAKGDNCEGWAMFLKNHPIEG